MLETVCGHWALEVFDKNQIAYLGLVLVLQRVVSMSSCRKREYK